MLHLYVGKENLPKDKQFIFDPEALTLILNLCRDEITTKVLEEIEEAQPQSVDTFTDRFGRGLFLTCLSTSTKILLGIHQTDYVVNGSELGYNAFDMLCSIPDGNVYFDKFLFDESKLNVPVCVNGSSVRNQQELFSALHVA